MRRRAFCASEFSYASWLSWVRQGWPGESCRAESFSGASYAVCSFNPVKDHLRTYWRGNHGKPFRTFDALAADLEAKRTRSSGYVDRRSRAPLTVFFLPGILAVLLASFSPRA